MVFDFRLPDERLFEAMRVMARHGGMLQVHCEDPVLLDAAVADALQRGDMAPRYHATTRPPFVEAVATARAPRVRPPGRCARPRRPPVVGGGAGRGPSRQGGRRPGERGDLSPLPGLHRGGIRRARPCPVRPLHDRAAAPVCGRPRRPLGRPGRRLARSRRDGPRPGSARRREGRRRAGRAVQRDQQRRSGHRDAAHDPLFRRCRARADHARADGRPHRHDPRPPVRPRREGRHRGRSRRRHRPVRPRRPPHDPRDRSPPHERLHAVRRHRGRRALSETCSSAAEPSSVPAPSSVGAGTAPIWSVDSRPVDALE